jgi:hypothetical protein
MASPKGEVELRVERIVAAGDGIAHWRCQPGLPHSRQSAIASCGARRACRGGHEGRIVELLVAGEGRRDPLSRDRPSPRVQAEGRG